MAIPWLRVLDAALSLSDLARGLNRRRMAALTEGSESDALARSAPVDAGFAGVAIAALKEVFDRDSQRLQFEREQRELERRRADRLLKLEWMRQTADRELARFRLLASLAVGGWAGTTLIAAFVSNLAVPARIVLGLGWALLLAALATSLTAHASITSELSRGLERPDGATSARPTGGDAGTSAPWLLISGLAVCAIAVLLR